MQLIDGKKIAKNLQQQLKEKISTFLSAPKLVVILVGDNLASTVYVKNKKKKAQEVGIDSSVITLPKEVSKDELIKNIKNLNDDKSVNGILVQLPLPPHIDQFAIINAIDPVKDVDCFHSKNVGNFVIGKNNFIPCTPYGCLYLIKHTLKKSLSGLDSLVIGRSNIVGKPMAQLLLQENCTVTIAHSHSQNIEQKCKESDIIVAAAGKPNLIKWAKKGAIVIDVGINSIGGKLIGDVDFSAVAKTAGAITPVPGGVGPMTITFLLINTVLASYKQQEIKKTVEDIIKPQN
ncbi:MAG: bifunctional methylenetetrahydrofolate dehydrogenase/methenyltetrahydrofolate cyclohydrolase [Rickettsiaceae bacterium H1]|nr:bifunctional methylenetetrahydrofolate dehydrogenase/methenyltetrahydrofolate cyclohydrolase [Rickettsiaceae bacterium H1]